MISKRPEVKRAEQLVKTHRASGYFTVRTRMIWCSTSKQNNMHNFT